MLALVLLLTVNVQGARAREVELSSLEGPTEDCDGSATPEKTLNQTDATISVKSSLVIIAPPKAKKPPACLFAVILRFFWQIFSSNLNIEKSTFVLKQKDITILKLDSFSLTC